MGLCASKLSENDREAMVKLLLLVQESQARARSENKKLVDGSWNCCHLDRRAEFQIIESVKYYFNDLDRIMRDDYAATQQDMLYARVRTSGIVEESIRLMCYICDVRYYKQQVLFELCDDLFLNKKDLFQDKSESGSQDCRRLQGFSRGIGDLTGCPVLLGKFMETNRQPEKEVYHHVTCATDSQNVQVVFNACKDIILKQNIKDLASCRKSCRKTVECAHYRFRMKISEFKGVSAS
ncbi:putative G protein alpha subunit, helical insertion [Plasmopara halstedii]